MFFFITSRKFQFDLQINKLSEHPEWLEQAAKWTETKWGYIRGFPGLAARKELISPLQDNFYIITYAKQPIGMFALFDYHKKNLILMSPEQMVAHDAKANEFCIAAGEKEEEPLFYRVKGVQEWQCITKKELEEVLKTPIKYNAFNEALRKNDLETLKSFLPDLLKIALKKGHIQDVNTKFPAKELMYVYVDESFRGLGVGSQMIEMAKQISEKQGAKMMVFDTLSSNLNRFYEKQGARVLCEGEFLKQPTTVLRI